MECKNCFQSLVSIEDYIDHFFECSQRFYCTNCQQTFSDQLSIRRHNCTLRFHTEIAPSNHTPNQMLIETSVRTDELSHQTELFEVEEKKLEENQLYGMKWILVKNSISRCRFHFVN